MKKIVLKLILSIICATSFIIPAFAGEVNLSVAASLKDVMAELTKNYESKNPEIKFLRNNGASGALAKQIAGGAPADIFFSANTEWIDFLKDKKLLDEMSITIFAYNVLVFAGKPDLNVKTMRDISKLDRIAIGSPKSVPAGDYAMQAMKKTGIDKQLESKLVLAKDARECLMYAEKSEVSGAFVYKTDANEIATKVKILFIVPQDLYSRITYPMAITSAGSKNKDAVSFYKFLQSDNAKAVLSKHGFLIK
jgi:molybdate transport system substrate-binding protein